eukprot:GHVS01027394.1.p1 GENE.GHVS01027394.1~~GHVS01027394.1.p1  ORF type:complete len:677 (+),score=273.05 GHVS01027394.1:65-2032(+)
MAASPLPSATPSPPVVSSSSTVLPSSTSYSLLLPTSSTTSPTSTTTSPTSTTTSTTSATSSTTTTTSAAAAAVAASTTTSATSSTTTTSATSTTTSATTTTTSATSTTTTSSSWSASLPAGAFGRSSVSNYLRAFRGALVNLIPFPWRANPPNVVLLAANYDLSDAESMHAFRDDFGSKILFTYRDRFTPIHTAYVGGPTTTTTTTTTTTANGSNTTTSGIASSASNSIASCVGHSNSRRCHRRKREEGSSRPQGDAICGGRKRRSGATSSSSSCSSCSSSSSCSSCSSSSCSSCSSSSSCSCSSSCSSSSCSSSSCSCCSSSSCCSCCSSSCCCSALAEEEEEDDEESGWREVVSDSGWGCMLRVGQMALAQCLVYASLGRTWRRRRKQERHNNRMTIRDEEDFDKQVEVVRQIIALFMDLPSSPFSLHNLVGEGRRSLGKAVADWFGPSTAATAACALMRAAATDVTRGVRPLLFEHGDIYTSLVKDEFSRTVDGTATTTGVLLWLCLRLGVEQFNQEKYQMSLQACFSIPQFQGLAGGGPSCSAYFFVAANKDSLFYLDPHMKCQTAFASHSEDGDLSEFFCDEPRQLPWRYLNPSMSLSFLCRNMAEYEDLCLRLKAVDNTLFEVYDQPPNYEYCTDGITFDDDDPDLVLL